MEPHRARKAVAVYLVAAPVLRLLVWGFARAHLDMVDCWTPTRMDSIAAGCLLALLAVDPVFRRRTQWSGRQALCLGALSLAMLIVSLVARRYTLYDIAFGYSVNAGAIAVLVWICMNQGDGAFAHLLNSRPLVTLGTLSYSLYLWQQPFLNPHNMGWACGWPVNLCFAVVAAAASHYCIEAPFLRLKDRVSGAGQRPAPNPNPPLDTPDRRRPESLCVPE
jgi:peptidoglycan/LPS O-acetylase OafA/YrhL